MQTAVLDASAQRNGKRRVAVPSVDDDRDLVRLVRTGDEEAFRSLFRRYGSIAKALAARVVRQPFLAEEIVQEAFLSLWRDPGSYREERGSFRAWLLSAVHHRAVDVVRREETQRRRAREGEAEPVTGIDVAETVVEEVGTEQSRAQLRAALKEIPAEQRQVLEMMYFEGKTQVRVSDELGLPLGTVKSRALLGMRRLRQMLAEVEP